MISLVNANALHIPLADESAQCVITSPPYWGLRDYNTNGQIGLEKTPEEYVCHLVAVCREVWRVLREDGTLWLNLGDSYAREGGTTSGVPRHWDGRKRDPGGQHDKRSLASEIGLKQKDLVGIPWRVAFALQADGWYLRSDIIWSKPNPMPESVTDRPTKAHEYIFLLSKSPKYFYDANAIRESASMDSGFAKQRLNGKSNWSKGTSLARALGNNSHGNEGDNKLWEDNGTRNRRTVWTVNTAPTPFAHFATFPPALVAPMVLAGCPQGGLVLDPFAGSGTVGQVCRESGRSFVGCDLSYTYLSEIALARASKKTNPEQVNDLPLFQFSEIA